MPLFTEQLARQPLPVVVDVWAPWCLPCRTLSPILDRVAHTYTGRVTLLKLNADEQPEAVRALNIFGIPTLLVFHQGRELTRRTGVQSEAQVTALFEAALSGQPAANTPTSADRVFRLGTALVLFLMGLATGPAPLLLGVSAAVAFSAVYDRCPVWQRVSAWLKARPTDKASAR